MSTFVPLSPGEEVQVQFTLPDHKVPFLAESTICWLKTGHLGVRFVSFSQEHKSELQGWLSRKLEETLPDSVAGNFQKIEGPRQRPPWGERRTMWEHPKTTATMHTEISLRSLEKDGFSVFLKEVQGMATLRRGGKVETSPL